jgi:hypothetical protein
VDFGREQSPPETNRHAADPLLFELLCRVWNLVTSGGQSVTLPWPQILGSTQTSERLRSRALQPLLAADFLPNMEEASERRGDTSCLLPALAGGTDTPLTAPSVVETVRRKR